MTKSTDNLQKPSQDQEVVTIVDASNGTNCFCYNRFAALDANGGVVRYIGRAEFDKLKEQGIATRADNTVHGLGGGPCYTSAGDETGVYDV